MCARSCHRHHVHLARRTRRRPASPTARAGSTSSGSTTDNYRILSDSTRNYADGATPWNTWLSCEETSRGYVYESDP
ncbi:secreted PhoX family phosphatase [Streptomyces africanus]|uniref:Secreted PhoX family phosphatase n=1 Tax=Streptomyces africanus TaxID=231024 RepID=A0ABU0QEN7_9ACTN|nr:secreted PhoX family phosphatase [Streptomyces africanus]